MCFDYDESPEFCQTTTPKSKKIRKCDCCWNPILPGEVYAYSSGKFDGSFFTYHCCRACEFDLHKIAAHELDHGCHWHEAWCNPDDLEEYLQETGGKRTPKELIPEWFDLKASRSSMVDRIRQNQLAPPHDPNGAR